VKFKILYPTIVLLLVVSLFSGLLFGDVSKGYAQSSRAWSDPINLSNSGGASNPVMVVDESGVMHVLWVDQYEGYKYVQSKDGKEWTSPQVVRFPFDTEGTLPVLVAGPSGLIYVFEQDIEKDLFFAQAHSATLNDPPSWGYRIGLSEEVLVYDVAIDAQGTLHVAYIRNANTDLGPAGVYYVRSSDGGTSWSTEKLLYESQYFRTAKPEFSHIRVATSSETGDGRVYIAWDNTSLKRIFMSASTDSGINWSDATQLKGPEDTGGYNTPFNVDISVAGNKSLLTWEVGEPGADQCTLYGQWSTDGGSTWGDQNVILDYRSICPVGVDFLVQDESSIVGLLSYQGNPSLLAWNGDTWSESQVQNEISYFSNPVTHETILLGCQFNFVYQDQLFLVGCDQGSGGDIWLTSRSILPVNNWSFPSTFWSLPSLLTTTDQKIPHLAYAADDNTLHAVWSQSPLSSVSDAQNTIFYSRWNGSQWSLPQNVIDGLNGPTGELSLATNGQGRLILVWADKKNGDLVFSSAISSRANISSEWEGPRDLPSPSQLSSSPDILVDASDRIVVVYAVPFNENRGIYIVQSTDDGGSWSPPVLVFDAASAGRNMVDHPKIALSGDGRLHVLFTSYSGPGNQPDGLYYSQSSDGGLTWSTPEVVSEASVVWSDIVSYDEQTVHRIWQENEDSVVANIDQVSQDGGLSWGKTVNVTGVSDTVLPVTLASNGAGELHLIQLVQEDAPQYIKEYNLSIQDWRWDGTRWDNQPSQELNIKGEKAQYSITAGMELNGFVSISTIAQYYDLEGELKNEIYTIGRSLGTLDTSKTPFPAVITNPGVDSVSTLPVDIQPIASIEPTPYPDILDDAPSVLSKNLGGILLVLLVIGLTIFIFIRRIRRSDHS